MQAILHPVPTCWHQPPASRAKRSTRPHALPQRPRLSAAAVQQAVAEAGPAAAAADEAPADAPAVAPIPVLDGAGWLGPETNGAPPPRALADGIMAAATEFGMFQLVHHGLSPKLVADLREAQRAFFALPLVSQCLSVGGLQR